LFGAFSNRGKDGQTLGEVDMLVETPDGETPINLKLRLFYLERLDLYPHHWIDPNKE